MMPLFPTVPGRSLPVTTTVCSVASGCKSRVATLTRPRQAGPAPKYTSPCPGSVLEKLTVKEAVTAPGSPGTGETAGTAATRGMAVGVGNGEENGVAVVVDVGVSDAV